MSATTGRSLWKLAPTCASTRRSACLTSLRIRRHLHSRTSAKATALQLIVALISLPSVGFYQLGTQTRFINLFRQSAFIHSLYIPEPPKQTFSLYLSLHACNLLPPGTERYNRYRHLSECKSAHKYIHNFYDKWTNS